MDDILVIGNDVVEMKNLKNLLAKQYEIKDLQALRYFLEMEVARSKKGIFVSQRKHILDLLNDTKMMSYKPGDTLIDQNHKLWWRNVDASNFWGNW